LSATVSEFFDASGILVNDLPACYQEHGPIDPADVKHTARKPSPLKAQKRANPYSSE
jgi:hypothetical protein